MYAIVQGIVDRLDELWIDDGLPDSLLTICGFAWVCITICIVCPVFLIESLFILFVTNILRRSVIYKYEISSNILELSDQKFHSLNDKFQEYFITDVQLTEYEKYIYYRYYIFILLFGKNNKHITDNLEKINKIKKLRDQCRSNYLIINLANLE
jgi:hypothetical protein